MNRLLIIGDSLSMSRYGEGVGYEDMYSSRISIAFPGRLIINASERGNTTARACTPAYMDEYVHPLMPDVVVLQLGVVDCLPRLLTELQRRLVAISSRFSITKILANRYVAYLSRRRLQITKKRPMSLVSREAFERNCRLIQSILIHDNPDVRFVVIDIPCPASSLSEKSYGADELVAEYNSILRRIFDARKSRFVDLYETTRCNPALLLPDGYHLNSGGHDFIFLSVKKILDEWTF